MKVLFLDVDGVLNDPYTPRRNPRGNMGVDQDKVEWLRRVIIATGANIVLSSTWRRIDTLREALREQVGPEIHARFIGCTPILESRDGSGIWVAKVRGDEIQAWLNEHPEVAKFAIVDDDADMAHLTSHLIQTDGRYGMSEKDADHLIEWLGVAE